MRKTISIIIMKGALASIMALLIITCFAQSTDTASYWTLTGNFNTNPTTSFIGTTNAIPLTVKVNNIRSGFISPDAKSANTSWGFDAASSIINGRNNTAIGYFSLHSNNNGNYNTAIGSQSLNANTGGRFNTGIGSLSLGNNTIGDNNTASGHSALYSNTTGSRNTASGANALSYNSTGEYNTATGYQSLFANSVGYGNTATGAFALQSNTTGMLNTAAGLQSLYSNIGGHDNTAFGTRSLYSNTNGLGNAAYGFNPLNSNTTGSYNTAIGFITLSLNTTGSENVACGPGALALNFDGNDNTAIGTDALLQNTSGSQNTALGAEANVTSNDFVNSTAIGAFSMVDVSNKVRIGNASVTVIEGQVPFTVVSDGRFKFNIQENVTGLNFILKLRPVTYQFDVPRFNDQLRNNIKQRSALKDDTRPNKTQKINNEALQIRRTGFIAQEVEKAAIETGFDFSGIIKPKNKEGYYGLSYECFVVPLVKAIQELSVKVDRKVDQSDITLLIEKQQQTIDEQNKKIAALQRQVKELLLFAQTKR